MFGINWNELFPTKTSFLVFITYMLLFVNQGKLFIIGYVRIFCYFFLPFLGILVTASQGSKNEYNYNTVAVVLLTEVLKLFISILLYCKE